MTGRTSLLQLLDCHPDVATYWYLSTYLVQIYPLKKTKQQKNTKAHKLNTEVVDSHLSFISERFLNNDFCFPKWGIMERKYVQNLCC